MALTKPICIHCSQDGTLIAQPQLRRVYTITTLTVAINLLYRNYSWFLLIKVEVEYRSFPGGKIEESGSLIPNSVKPSNMNPKICQTNSSTDQRSVAVSLWRQRPPASGRVRCPNPSRWCLRLSKPLAGAAALYGSVRL